MDLALFSSDGGGRTPFSGAASGTTAGAVVSGFATGATVGAAAGAIAGAGAQAIVAAGAQPAGAEQTGANFGAQGLHLGAQGLQTGAHLGAQGLHLGAQGLQSKQWQANKSANRPPKGRNSQQVDRGASQVATGTQGLHLGAQGLQTGAQFVAGVQVVLTHELQISLQAASKRREAAMHRNVSTTFFPGYHSPTIPQSISQRKTGAHGLHALHAGAPQPQEGAGWQDAGAHVAGAAQVAGAQDAGAHFAGAAQATGAQDAGATAATTGAQAGAQAAGAQAAFAPQKPQLN